MMAAMMAMMMMMFTVFPILIKPIPKGGKGENKTVISVAKKLFEASGITQKGKEQEEAKCKRKNGTKLQQLSFVSVAFRIFRP